MADGSPDDCTGLKQMKELTFSAQSALDSEQSDINKCSGQTLNDNEVKLSMYTKLESGESCEKSDSRGVAANHSRAPERAGSQTRRGTSAEDGEDRKKRCFDRYDSSESSDSGIAVLSPSESSASGSDITEPRSPRSPESGCSAGEEGGGARMPPWSHSEPAPAPAPAPPPAPASAPAPLPTRRLGPQPAPARRSNHSHTLHRRITEFFSHKMKPPTGKREANAAANDDTKRKCLPKNGVTHDLEKYISYLSQTLSPKVMLDVNKSEAARKATITNGAVDSIATDLSKKNTNMTPNGSLDYSKPKDNKDRNHINMNGFVEVRHGTDSFNKEKSFNGALNGLTDHKKANLDKKVALDPSANGVAKHNKQITELSSKFPISAASDLSSHRKTPVAVTQSPKKSTAKFDSSKMNGVVSSTTKFDTRMNSVTCGSNNISLSPVTKTTPKQETTKRTQTQPAKRTNRKSSACIANSKNLTWSKANNLKQQVQQLQKQNCITTQQPGSPAKTNPEANAPPNINITNGVRQVSMTMNGSLGGLNMPMNNVPNCHPLNIPQPCNGTVTSTNLQSFVAVPQNVMLTTLRIPQNSMDMQTQTINQPNGLNSFTRHNVNGVNVSSPQSTLYTSSPTKINGPFVFPFVQNITQNINGAVVQIPSLMAAKVSSYVIPQSPHRQDHLLINGTLLKLTNNMASSYPNMNKPMTATSQPLSVMNKNVAGLPTMAMSVPPKPNYAVNLSHPVLVPQPGFIVTSVPNMNVKETWSYTGTNSVPSAQISCSTPLVHHPPIIPNYATQALHSSNIPIAPVKPPDNPIQGTDPPSSTVKDPPPEISEPLPAKCEVPWLSKTVNNNIFPLDSKIPTRAFSQLSSLSNKFEEKMEIEKDEPMEDEGKMSDESRSMESLDESLRKVEEVARREDTIFTQITVLKDVSSNVQNTVIEANFCSASSESGIGTDKSIDSPSDSQTSKECDEDSSLSLTVSVCEEAVCSQKSPILKQPQTLRFPPRAPAKAPGGKRTSSTDATATVCMWENCKNEFDNDTDLLEHLQSSHVETQAGRENYVCNWVGCKVRGKPSCSRLWLERHALSHGGNKPFKCIVDGCERRFSTQILLERHVNNHFTEVSPNSGAGKKTAEGSGAKLIRRNGKKLRYRRQPWSARMFDFFDAGMMEGLAWRLSRCTRWRLGGACPLREPPGRHTLTLHAALTATRYNAQLARREALITYYPPNVLEDEWVPEKEVRRIKRVEISELPAETKVSLYEQFTASYRKAPSPPPAKEPRPPPPAPRAPRPPRTLPARHCTSSRLLNNLLKKKQPAPAPTCSATNVPLICEDPPASETSGVSGAKKRKMGRRHGGNAFWPCGR